MDNQASDAFVEIGRRIFVAGFLAESPDRTEEDANRAHDAWEPDETIIGMIQELDEKLKAADADPEGLGIGVRLIDVFSAWGEREAKDTALLIDLCIGATMEEVIGEAALPATVKITGASLERLANSGRILRLEQEPNEWAITLYPSEKAPDKNPPENGEADTPLQG